MAKHGYDLPNSIILMFIYGLVCHRPKIPGGVAHENKPFVENMENTVHTTHNIPTTHAYIYTIVNGLCGI